MSREAQAWTWWLGLTMAERARLLNSIEAEMCAHGLTRSQAVTIVWEQETGEGTK